MSLPLNLILALSLTPAVSQDGELKVNFVDDVAPILREYCVSCHRGSRAKNGLKLKSLRNLIAGGSSGSPVVPGDASASLLYLVMAHEKSPTMPPDEDKLEPELLSTIRSWIDEGCRETADSAPFVAANSSPAFVPAALPINLGPTMPVRAPTQAVWSTKRAQTVTALDVSPAAPLAAVAGHEQVTLYGLENDEVLAVLPFPEGQVHSLRFNQSGSILLGGGGRAGDSGLAVAWDVASGERLFSVGDEPDVVLDADLSLDNSTVILGGPDRIARAYSTQTGELVYELTKHNDWVTACAFSPDGVLVATADRSGGLFVWEAMTGRQFHQLEVAESGVNALDWRGDSMVLSVGNSGGDIRQYEMNSGTRVRRWNAHGGIQDIDYLRDGRIASCGMNGGLLLSNGDGSLSFNFSKAGSATTSVACTSDGAHLVVGTLRGELLHYVAKDMEPKSHLRVNPKTDEERAVLRAEAALMNLSDSIPSFDSAAAEAKLGLAELTRTLPPVKQRAEQEESAAQAAEGQATQARSAETAAGERLDLLTRPLREKEEAASVADQEHARRSAAATNARPTLDQALMSAAAAEEALALAPEEIAAQVAFEASKQDLMNAKAVIQLAEIEAARTEVLAHSARRALSIWTTKLEGHAAEHTALRVIADEMNLVAMNARARAQESESELAAFMAKHTVASDLFSDASEILIKARADHAQHTSSLESARPTWEALQIVLLETGGRVPR
jgi:hypothetical protein